MKTEDGQLVIARILAGGAVDRQGLLHVGDIIGEVNGIVVRSAEQLQVKMKENKSWHFEIRVTGVYLLHVGFRWKSHVAENTFN